MKAKLLIMMVAITLLIMPSCKKQHGQWTKRVITEEYEYADGQNAISQENAPKLWRWSAKKMAKEALKEEKIINNPVVVPFPMGYYQCNDEEDRASIYATQVNGLINASFSEIINQYNRSTYWVEVSLTPAGELLIVEENKGELYPEDTITYEHMISIISPKTGKNQYGEYTFDPNVDSTIVSLLNNFYKQYITNKETAINLYGTQDLIQAQARIDLAKDLGLNRLSKDPFLRKATTELDDNTISVVKWTDYIDLYIATLNNQEYCIVIKDENGIKKIDDIALHTPDYIKEKQTLRCIALNISAKELHYAQIRKDKVNAANAKYSKTKKTYKKTTIKHNDDEEVEEEEEYVEEEVLDFDEYTPLLQPGIVEVERTEPTLFEIAEGNEYENVVNLLAGDFKFAKLGNIRDIEPTRDGKFRKAAIVVIERTNVSPLGRIFFDMKEGEKESYDLIFTYENEEWICTVDGRH